MKYKKVLERSVFSDRNYLRFGAFYFEMVYVWIMIIVTFVLCPYLAFIPRISYCVFCILNFWTHGPRLKGREPRGPERFPINHVSTRAHTPSQVWSKIQNAQHKMQDVFCILNFWTHGPRLKGREPRGRDGLIRTYFIFHRSRYVSLG